VPTADAAAPSDLPADLSPDSAVPTADAAAPSDLPADLSPDSAVPTADAAAPPDLPAPPDLSPDLPVDLAPDLARDSSPSDTAPPPLVIDDFQSPVTTVNNLGSEVTWDHESCSRVNGESVCHYTGSGGFHDFLESLNHWCAFDAKAYTKLRFRLRTSAPGEMVDVWAGINPNSACSETLSLLGTITTTTTMTTYTLDVGPLTAKNWLTLFELAPRSVTTTDYILDDVELVP
jgi:hypothetical protein